MLLGSAVDVEMDSASRMLPSAPRAMALSAAGSTPRIGTFASVPVERLGRLMMTNSSADASGPAPVRVTPGASAMMRVLSRKKPLTISLSAPLRKTMAASGEPEASGVFFDLDPETGRCAEVQAFRVSESRMRSKETWKTFSRP